MFGQCLVGVEMPGNLVCWFSYLNPLQSIWHWTFHSKLLSDWDFPMDIELKAGHPISSVLCWHQPVNWPNKCSRWLLNTAERVVWSPRVFMEVLQRDHKSVTWKEVWISLGASLSEATWKLLQLTGLLGFRCGNLHCNTWKTYRLLRSWKDQSQEVYLPCSWWSWQDAWHGIWTSDQKNCGSDKSEYKRFMHLSL